MGRKMVTRLLPLFGFLFLTAYVRSASADIVYSDYIRLVNTYLENVWSFRPPCTETFLPGSRRTIRSGS